MELYQLEQFVTIAECESMAKAAKRLFVSRSALSQNLKRLEAELNCELFTREHNRLVITPFGEIVLEHSKSIIKELSATQEGIEREKRKQAAMVRIGHFSMPLCYFKMPHMAQELPNITFEVRIEKADTLCDGLIDGEYDLVIVPSSISYPAGVSSVVIETERACLSVPASSRLYGRQSVKLSELAGEKLFLTDNLPGSSEWYAAMASTAMVDRSDIEVVEAEHYLDKMSGNDRCHFSTIQMINFFGLGNGRMAVEIEDDIATRTVTAAYQTKDWDLVAPVIEYLRMNRRDEYGSYDIFPYLMFPGRIKNLSIS